MGKTRGCSSSVTQKVGERVRKGQSYFLPEGTRLGGGKYEILGLVGSPGGFGITYKARWVAMDRVVAIKEFFVSDSMICTRHPGEVEVVTANKEIFQEAKGRFLEEARRLFDLSHRGVVRVYDVFEENNTAYIVMEYLEGERLREYVEEKGKLEVGKARELIKEIGEALGYVHGRGLVHRDMSPENVVFRDKGCREPVLIDFGLAREYAACRTRSVVAWRDGFSPLEAYSAEAKKGPWTDVYSLGALFYYMVEGKEPPGAPELVQGVELRIEEWVGEVERGVIERAMKVRVDERFSTVEEFLRALEGEKSADKTSQGERAGIIGQGEERKRGQWSALVKGVKIPDLEVEERERFEKKYKGVNLKEAVKKAIESGKERDFWWLLERVELDQGEKNEFLLLAAKRGLVEVVKVLLEQGADEDVKDKLLGSTPLHEASSKGHAEVVKVLLEYGADEDVKDKLFGSTPLHWAALVGYVEVVKLLLKHGADVNAKDKDGRTPLHRAAEEGHVEVVKVLLRHGTDVNVRVS